MSNDILHFANIVVGSHGQVMIAIREAGLDPDMLIEVHLKIGNCFEIFQGLDIIGQIDNTPDEAMAALATAKQVVLVEVGENGPARTHEMVSVRSGS